MSLDMSLTFETTTHVMLISSCSNKMVHRLVKASFQMNSGFSNIKKFNFPSVFFQIPESEKNEIRQSLIDSTYEMTSAKLETTDYFKVSTVFSTPVKKRAPRPSFPLKGPSAPPLKGTPVKNGLQVVLSISNCLKMIPYAVKMHLESI
jgi:hypothetical protein